MCEKVNSNGFEIKREIKPGLYCYNGLLRWCDVSGLF